jgi:hypothetical protein
MARRYVVTKRRTRALAAVRGLLERPGEWRSAWVVGYVAMMTGGSIWQTMSHHHVATVRMVGVTGLVGVLGGCVWQWLNRRDLVDRFSIVAMLLLAGLVLSVLPIGATDIDVRSVAPSFGLLVGNVLTEWWLRLPRQRERYGAVEPMHQPHRARTASTTAPR